jgi:hypothetical protein
MKDMKMRYRLEEDANGYMSVRHVETDRAVGTALERPVYIDGKVVNVFETFNNAGECVGYTAGYTSSYFHSFPFEIAAKAIANHEELLGFPDLEGADWNVKGDRVERRLGNLVADTALAFARGFCEAVGHGLTAETRDQFAASLAELASLSRVSRAGCFDATTRTIEPYFASVLGRLDFSHAAELYGMWELRARCPDLTCAEREKLAGWVLRWLSDLLSDERVNQKRRRIQRNSGSSACPPSRRSS